MFGDEAILVTFALSTIALWTYSMYKLSKLNTCVTYIDDNYDDSDNDIICM